MKPETIVEIKELSFNAINVDQLLYKGRKPEDVPEEEAQQYLNLYRSISERAKKETIRQLIQSHQKTLEDQAPVVSVQGFLESVWEIISAEKDHQVCFDKLKDLVREQPEEILTKALLDTPTINNGQQRQKILLALVPQLPSKVINKNADLIFSAIESFAWVSDSAITLQELSTFLPVEYIPNSARRIMRKTEKSRYRLNDAQEWGRISHQFCKMASILPEDIFDFILDQAIKIDFYSGPDEDKDETADVLSGHLIIGVVIDLRQNITPNLLIKALNCCNILSDDKDRAWVAGVVAEHLIPELYNDGLAAARSNIGLNPRTARAILDRLSKRLSPMQLEEAVEIARQNESPELVLKLEALRK